ncbi:MULTISPECIES: hypothetical protein [Paraburkholderia]|uniref:hypothetical protein n=1 Tax=Paraburkholderia TaxID=1822464 RepID=UPI0022524064|nr:MULTISPECIES: hypothetical protein [Paraburkholderia]MCX4175668.1 hypothetical protein [Paraburkholderia madseniana]MDQ6463663.1 hypothetical protein [Paraburkholderia madseniana]
MTGSTYRKTFQFQTSPGLNAGVRTFTVAITSTLHEYRARVTEMTSREGPVPVMISHAAGHRNDLSPPAFHRMRRHHRGELYGTVLAALRNGHVERIDRQPHVPNIAVFDCFIRVSPEQLEIMHPPFGDAVEDDMSDWPGALKVFPETGESE